MTKRSLLLVPLVAGVPLALLTGCATLADVSRMISHANDPQAIPLLTALAATGPAGATAAGIIKLVGLAAGAGVAIYETATGGKHTVQPAARGANACYHRVRHGKWQEGKAEASKAA